MIRQGIFCVASLVIGAACKETSGPATAVTLSLHSVDGARIPAPMTTASGQRVTIGKGFLQGTNWGHACGFAVGLTEGPLTTVAIPSCRLQPDVERTFTITFNDVRFPAGPHEYRFVPE